jgi:6-phosphogluconolactonase
MPLSLEVLPDADAACRRAAEVFAGTVAATAGPCSVAVSGGRSPWAMFAHLEGMAVPWENLRIFQVDERIAPDGDPDRNLTHLSDSVPVAARGGLIPMPVTAADPDAAASDYALRLPPAFDLIHLGLGPDGHTASLVPGDPVLAVTDRDVAVTGEYQGHRRMTLTYPPLDRAHRILWLVTGADKVSALERLLDADPGIPAGRVAQERALVIADRAAAGR